MHNVTLLIHPEELSYAWIDRLVAHGIPTLALHPVGGRRAHESLAAMVEQLQGDEMRRMLDYAAAQGLRIEYEMHAARYLLPASLFSAHPTWFRMNEQGERTADYNLCASNEQALDYVAQRAAALARSLYRSTNRYFFWLDDGKQLGCHCPKCRHLSDSDQQLLVLNRILERLRRDDAHATLAYLAYCSTIEPPRTVKPHSGVFLEYAPFLRDFHRPLCEDAQSRHIEPLLQCFGRAQAKALDYWYDNSLYSKWTKPPAPFTVDRAVLQADMDFYHRLGFGDVSSFACYLGADYEALHGEVDISDIGRLYRAYRDAAAR